MRYKEESKDEDFGRALSLFSAPSAEMTPASCALQCRMHAFPPPICGSYSRSYGEQITAKLPHWSEGSSSCAGNSQKGSLPKFAVPTLVGTIKEIITDIFHFSAYVLLWGKPFSSADVMLRVTAACMCILHAVAQGGGCWSSSRKCRKCQTASKRFVWPLVFSVSAGSVESPFEQGISPNNVPYYIK